MEQGTCPLCQSTMKQFEGYPHTICHACATQEDIRDASGYPVAYANASGEFVSYHHIEGTNWQKEDPICFVKGIRCYAAKGPEGIIIEVIR